MAFCGLKYHDVLYPAFSIATTSVLELYSAPDWFPTNKDLVYTSPEFPKFTAMKVELPQTK